LFQTYFASNADAKFANEKLKTQLAQLKSENQLLGYQQEEMECQKKCKHYAFLLELILFFMEKSFLLQIILVQTGT
jgi:hypothetical protein